MSALLKLLEERNTLVVSLPSNRKEVYDAAVEGGADAVKFHLNVEHRASGNRFGTIEENRTFIEELHADRRVPVGVVPGDALQKISPELVLTLKGLQFDFISLYAHHSPAWLLGESGFSKMIAVNDQSELIQAAAFSSLGVDILEASIMKPEQYGTSLTVQDLAAYRLLARSFDRPVVVPTQKAINERDLANLFQTGIKGLMIGAMVTGHDPESIYRTTKRFKERMLTLE